MPFSARQGFFSSGGGVEWYDLTKEEILTEISTWTGPSPTTSELSSFTVPSSIFDVSGAYFHPVNHPNGYIYVSPSSTTRDKYLRFDPLNNTFEEFDCPPISGTGMYVSGALANNGKIYYAPNNMDKVLIVDPATETAELQDWGLTLGLYAACLSFGDKIVAVGGRATNALIIDTEANTAIQTNFGIPGWFGTISSGSRSAAPVRSLYDGKGYFIPYQGSAQSVLVYNPEDDTAIVDTFDFTWRNQGTQGSGNGKNGNIYISGHNIDTDLRRLDPAAETVTVIANSGKVYSAQLGTEGNIYMFPGQDGFTSAYYDAENNILTKGPSFIPTAMGSRNSTCVDIYGNVQIFCRYGTSGTPDYNKHYTIAPTGTGNANADLHKKIRLSSYFNKGGR